MSRRYERASMVLTSDTGFDEWGAIFGDEPRAAALIDRLLHHSHIVNICGLSYRMRQHRDLALRRATQNRRPVRPPKLRSASQLSPGQLHDRVCNFNR